MYSDDSNNTPATFRALIMDFPFHNHPLKTKRGVPERILRKAHSRVITSQE